MKAIIQLKKWKGLGRLCWFMWLKIGVQSFRVSDKYLRNKASARWFAIQLRKALKNAGVRSSAASLDSPPTSGSDQASES